MNEQQPSNLTTAQDPQNRGAPGFSGLKAYEDADDNMPKQGGAANITTANEFQKDYDLAISDRYEDLNAELQKLNKEKADLGHFNWFEKLRGNLNMGFTAMKNRIRARHGKITPEEASKNILDAAKTSSIADKKYGLNANREKRIEEIKKEMEYERQKRQQREEPENALTGLKKIGVTSPYFVAQNYGATRMSSLGAAQDNDKEDKDKDKWKGLIAILLKTLIK